VAAPTGEARALAAARRLLRPLF